MGIEYQIRSERYDAAKCAALMPKVTSAAKARIDVRDNQWEFRWGEEQDMPNVLLEIQPDGVYLVYYGGTMQSWAVIGLFLSVCADWFGPTTIEEL
jgi:hypothetical protein